MKRKGGTILKKKIVTTMSILICIVGMYVILHITPTIALRTHVFVTGNPIRALTTGIVDDKFHNKVDKELLESQNAKCYRLTKPVFEKATQGELRNFKVTKKGFLFFAEYYGEC